VAPPPLSSEEGDLGLRGPWTSGVGTLWLPREQASLSVARGAGVIAAPRSK